MLLREFFYYNNDNNLQLDRRYDVQRDSSVLDRSDTRKIRLTLKQINELRMQAEAHDYEKESELGFISQMYGAPAGEEAAEPTA